MAAPTVVKRGKASVEGIPGSIDVVVYPVQQSGKMTQNYEEEKVMDVHGFAAAWLARDEHFLLDFGFKLLGDTQAHAIAGGAFLGPLAVVILTGFDLAAFNGSYQNISGDEIDLSNVGVGTLAKKLRRYSNVDQAAASIATPS